MEFGAHLPVMDFGGTEFGLQHLLDYMDAAADLGYDTLAVNDHMVFATPVARRFDRARVGGEPDRFDAAGDDGRVARDPRSGPARQAARRRSTS